MDRMGAEDLADAMLRDAETLSAAGRHAEALRCLAAGLAMGAAPLADAEQGPRGDWLRRAAEVVAAAGG